jgi:putative copper export protein
MVAAATRRFNQVAWTAFGVLIITGIWNVVAVSPQIEHRSGYRTTLMVKLVVVVVSGVTAALHVRSRTARGRVVLGARLPGSARWPRCSSACCWPAERYGRTMIRRKIGLRTRPN